MESKKNKKGKTLNTKKSSKNKKNLKENIKEIGYLASDEGDKKPDNSKNCLPKIETYSEKIQAEVDTVIKMIELKRKQKATNNLFIVEKEKIPDKLSENSFNIYTAKKENELFSMISLEKDFEKLDKNELEKRKKENDMLRKQFKELIEPMKKEIINIENLRKIEDEMLKKKREREDLDISNKRDKLDNDIRRANSRMFKEFKYVIKNVALIRKIEDESLNK